jgi:uncharacterized protein YdbL (DUF1318 family)
MMLMAVRSQSPGSAPVLGLAGLLVTLVAVACVTVNIYFPAAAAEKAADAIIRDVWGQDALQPRGSGGGETEPRSGLGAGAARWASALLDGVVKPAQAQANITISTPAIDRLRASMRARHERLKPYYGSGAVGLTRDAEVSVRDLNAVPLPQRTQVKKLVADENRDRTALYREIAKANGHPEWEGQIRQTFARQWIENAPSGWWYQDAGGAWRRK